MSDTWSQPPPAPLNEAAAPQPRMVDAVARMIGVFAVVGLGLGGGTLIFLSATGFFDPVRGLDDFGRAILGGFAVSSVLVFALLIGVVLAAVGGLYVVNTAPDRGRAIAAGAVAGALGHVALVVCVGAVLLTGIELLEPGRTAVVDSSDESSPVPTASDLFGDAPCEETFGEDSPLCDAAPSVPSLPDVPASSDESSDVVTAANLVKIGLGVVPAAFVGGLVALLLFRRRTPPETWATPSEV